MIDWAETLVVITGSEGMIGKELTQQLLRLGASVRQIDLKNGQDLRDYENCVDYTMNADYVFHLMGVKGSPKMTNEKPADFFVPMVQCNTNLLEACRRNKIKGVLYTSSIAVLNPETDRFPAWAKMTGEVQIEAYKVQYPEFGNNCCIVRPANVYGRFDNFNNPNAMVITSLISKSKNEEVIEVWGDGTELRDFVNAKDVARAMILVMEKMPQKPINIGSGEIYSISEVAHTIGNLTGKKIVFKPKEARGDSRRDMDITMLQALGFKPAVSLKDGIKEALAEAQK